MPAIIAALAFTYVLVRAVVVGPTYDEVSTIPYFVPASVVRILNPSDANNHLLNTLLIKLLFATGHQTLFHCKTADVVAFAAYLWFGYLIAKRVQGGTFCGAVVLLLVANPFLLDFFALARGYGIALGAQMASLYYVLSLPASSRPGRTMTHTRCWRPLCRWWRRFPGFTTTLRRRALVWDWPCCTAGAPPGWC